MNELQRRKLDEDAFPERAFAPGEQGVRAEMMPGGKDQRIAAPADAVILLVVFRVPQTKADPGWQLEFESVNAKGEPQMLRVALVDPPPSSRQTNRVPTPADLQIPPGLMYVGAFWVDLTSLVQRRLLQPGRQARVRHGSNQAAVPVNY